MTIKTWAERAKANTADRRRRLIKRLKSGTSPLRMFARTSLTENSSDLERNIKIGNMLHLEDLKRERDDEK